MVEKFEKFVSKIVKEMKVKDFNIDTKHRLPNGLWVRVSAYKRENQYCGTVELDEPFYGYYSHVEGDLSLNDFILHMKNRLEAAKDWEIMGDDSTKKKKKVKNDTEE